MFKVQRFTFLIYFIALITIGSVGFYLIGGDEWSFIDSMYMTILTLSTVGFGEVHPLSEIGKLWAILLIIFGVSGFAYIVYELGSELIQLNPGPDVMLSSNQKVILIGTLDNLQSFLLDSNDA